MAKQTISDDIFIDLAGESRPLKCSLKAATAVSTRFGGFMGAGSTILNRDLASMIFIVRQAIPMRDMSSKDLEEAVYQAGTRNLVDPLTKYIGRLANGGRDPNLEDDDDRDEGDDEDQDEGNGEG
ncbi:hypothetical protein [Antarcticirhabdus aurantiaca]|uniref:Uncharacterized protein n=1 Tax=Antarcticirhabdus aurantiaca TaxID=2606717 RepID=A0ACD4NRD9_9HYPH|nr:hypothetical protein OXU80_03585 [Jeongeuplla avenae]